MINAKELKIGNRVNRRYFNPQPNNNHYAFDACTIDVVKRVNVNLRLDDNSILSKCSLEMIYPIELTEDILIKCGFEPEFKGETQCNYYKNNVEIIWWEDRLFYKRSLTTYTKLKHLHQLQNLYFALTGEELSIKLNAQESDTTEAK